MRYGYFDSELDGYDADGMPIFDRAENSEFYALMWQNLVTDGVMVNPLDSFQVKPKEGMTVVVRPGFAICQGRFCLNEEEQNFILDGAATSYDRYDRIVLRLNYEERIFELLLRKGTANSNPVPPALVRDEYFYDMCLATIKVGARVTEIKAGNIADTRGDVTLCGFVSKLGETVDFATCIDMIPVQKGTVTYTGEPQSPNWEHYDPDELVYSGETEGTNAGTYTVRFRPKEGYSWADGKKTSIEITWDIARKQIPIPTLDEETYTYDGTEKIFTLKNVDESIVLVSGVRKGTNAGTYELTASLIDKTNYEWTDGTQEDKEFSVVIERAKVAKPTVDTEHYPAYDGTVKLPTLNGFDENIMSVESESTGPGNATATVSIINNNYCWTDGSYDPFEVTYTILSQSPNLVLSSTEVTVNNETPEVTVTASYDGAGTLSVQTSHPNHVIADVSGKTITIRQVSSAVQIVATITATVSSSGTYGSDTAKITVNKTSGTPTGPFAEVSDETFAAMVAAADAGDLNLSDFWHIGDTRRIKIGEIPQSGVIPAQHEQYVDLVILHKPKNNAFYNLSEPIGSKTTPSFIIGIKECLAYETLIDFVSTQLKAEYYKDGIGTVSHSYVSYTFATNNSQSGLSGMLNDETNGFVAALPAYLQSCLKTVARKYSACDLSSENGIKMTSLGSVNQKVTIATGTEITGTSVDVQQKYYGGRFEPDNIGVYHYRISNGYRGVEEPIKVNNNFNSCGEWFDYFAEGNSVARKKGINGAPVNYYLPETAGYVSIYKEYSSSQEKWTELGMAFYITAQGELATLDPTDVSQITTPRGVSPIMFI